MEEREGIPCEICGQVVSATSVCSMCKSAVCSECFNTELGICYSCDEARCTICGDYLSSRACNSCGRLVCEDHGTKIGEATLCDICGTDEP
ncbi:MAG: hypothetical protein ACTSV3_08905 [Candidatus Thorarchaeota archaeon]|nr:MAG: hypothetical protein DRP09_11615 [Candidatus Thorarchaeota archaeon]RLI59102.1 MAG: hypothetical protein DRO87_03895 [Candidatus Thorarchaeota archaeon]